jgi:membrane associated rhomboid family serine protease
MLIPYSSDAPLYHRPVATIGLIVVNVLMFFLWPPYEPDLSVLYFAPPPNFETYVDEAAHDTGLSDDELASDELTEEQIQQLGELAAQKALDDWPDTLKYPDWRMLQFGNGLRPWQWLFANFMHDDFMHLAVNMIYLWVMGMVVEGKVGWRTFLLIYLGIGILGYAFVQVVMLGADSGNALGASLPIYGLMVIALLWAPLNELNCIWFWARGGVVDISILYFALGYLVLQVAFFLLGGMSMSSEALHLTGALFGLPIGLLMLIYKKVDCENYDAISVIRGRHEMTREELAQERDASPEYQAKIASQRETYLAQIEKLVAEGGDPALAWTVHLKMRNRFENWQLPEKTLRGIIKLYHQRKQVDESLPAMFELLRCYQGEQTIDVRLLAAQTLARLDRPRQALKTLAVLDPEKLCLNHRAAYDKITRYSERRLEEVDLEVPIEDL